MHSPCRSCSLVAALLVVAVTATLTAQAKQVPSQYPTITAALAAASPGDTILVAAGVYNEILWWPNVDGIRLLGEQGAAATVIDGGASNTVITFMTFAVTRATVVAGFTIRNGTAQNNVGGILIRNCSPTIRDNRITGNLRWGTGGQSGGGVRVETQQANPLLLRNEIDNNEVRDGSWNEGAGISVGPGARADIIANDIHDNRLTMTGTAIAHSGFGAGIYCEGTALIASNRIVANTSVMNHNNQGGGIAVQGSGVASVFNNTIAINHVSGGVFSNSGGGVYVGSNASATLRGNIVVANSSQGVYRATGGSGVVTCNADDVWANVPVNYVGLAPGPNSISVDPLFVSGTHLLAGSPCIDAIDAAHLPPVASMDVDGDPRRIDGDLDGGTTNGARLDIGADESNGAVAGVSGLPQIGTTVSLTIAFPQPALCCIGVGLDTGNLFLEPWGNVLLGPTSQLFAAGATPASLPLSIPNDPTLRGITLHGQGLVLSLVALGGQLTNLVSLTVF